MFSFRSSIALAALTVLALGPAALAFEDLMNGVKVLSSVEVTGQ